MIKSLRKLKNIRYGEVTGCNCLMTVEGVDEIYPIWNSNQTNRQSISIEDKLLLFETSEFMTADGITSPKQIVFYSYYTTVMQTAVTPIMKLYNEFKDKELGIKFGAAYGRFPTQLYTKK
jgi:hypothetical protein